MPPMLDRGWLHQSRNPGPIVRFRSLYAQIVVPKSNPRMSHVEHCADRAVTHPKAGSPCSSAGSARAIPSQFAGALPASAAAKTRWRFIDSAFLSFMGFVILSQFSRTIAVRVVISIAGIALMIAAATLMTWTSKQDRPGRKLF